jgi:hypothetical protein
MAPGIEMILQHQNPGVPVYEHRNTSLDRIMPESDESGYHRSI